jgi:hypothetical protein
MNVAYQFVVGLVELGERHNQMHGAEYYKPKTRIQTSNKTQPWWIWTQQSNWKMKIAALRVIGQWKEYFFFCFSWWSLVQRQKKTNYKAHNNTSGATWNLIPLDERLVPDLLRGRSRSIGGDLDVSEEGSEQMIITLQSLHHDSVGYQHTCTQVGLVKKAKFP